MALNTSAVFNGINPIGHKLLPLSGRPVLADRSIDCQGLDPVSHVQMRVPATDILTNCVSLVSAIGRLAAPGLPGSREDFNAQRHDSSGENPEPPAPPMLWREQMARRGCQMLGEPGRSELDPGALITSSGGG